MKICSISIRTLLSALHVPVYCKKIVYKRHRNPVVPQDFSVPNTLKKKKASLEHFSRKMHCILPLGFSHAFSSYFLIGATLCK